MAVSFPLYDDLRRQVESAAKVSSIDWKILAPTVNGLSTKQCQTIYALILHHYLLDNPVKLRTGKDIAIPYSAKVLDGGKGLVYTLGNLPLPLQQVLAEFITNYE